MGVMLIESEILKNEIRNMAIVLDNEDTGGIFVHDALNIGRSTLEYILRVIDALERYGGRSNDH